MIEHDDDKPVGRVLSRREMLVLLGGAGTAFVVGTGFTRLNVAQDATPVSTAVPSCVVRPEMTEGPYFVDDQFNRFDIRVDPSDGGVKEGIPLLVKFYVSDVTDGACVPLPNAQIDVWHCDALGIYSGVEDASFNTVGQKWLRGYQITDENGLAQFLSIYPGWYQGRTVHFHFKIRTDSSSDTGYEFTSQLYFPDDLSDQIFTLEPYSEKMGERDTRNDTDMHYANDGDQLLLELTEITTDDFATAVATAEATAEPVSRDGYQASFYIGLDLSDADVGASDSFQMGGGGAPGGGGPPPGG